VARAVLKAAPDADVTLVRIDPAAPYMLQAVARAVNDQSALADLLRDRLSELGATRTALDQRHDKLMQERKEALAGFADESQKDFLEKKKKSGLLLTGDEELELAHILRREEYRKHHAQWDADEAEHQRRAKRYAQLSEDLVRLKDARVVASALTWNDGWPADGGGVLSRYFDEHPFHAAIWFQSAGDTRGQAWAGLFRDSDGNGVMEFAAPGPTATKDAWSRELNFLEWRPSAGKETRDLPKDARVRITLQWREVHDSEAGRSGQDPYLRPLADLRIVVLRQLDPDGAKRPADDFEVVAQSSGAAQRLEATPSSATYEISLILPPQAAPGRYAVRIEGRAPDSTRPRDEPSIPAAKRAFELRPRLFLETLDGDGRAVFQSFPTDVGTLGAPADARSVVTVGAADSKGKRQSYSAVGGPYGAELMRKPDVLAYDQVESGQEAAQGSGLAVGFAAGTAATALGVGAPLGDWLHWLGVEPGGVLRVPEPTPRK
jgi:hypothetical protein